MWECHLNKFQYILEIAGTWKFLPLLEKNSDVENGILWEVLSGFDLGRIIAKHRDLWHLVEKSESVL